MVVIALDAGHGKHTAGKRTPDGEREWAFNDVVLRAAAAELNKYKDVTILRLDDPTGETDVSLTARTNKANAAKAAILVSIHHNALNGVWGAHTGTETFIYPGSTNGRALANAVHPKLVAAFGLRDRGIKEQNFHMLREATMPAILTEGGYMDSTIDIKALRNQAKLTAQGVAIAQGVVAYLKLVKKEVAPVETELTPAQEAVRQEAIALGLTDGKNPLREANQFYVWSVMIPIARRVKELEDARK